MVTRQVTSVLRGTFNLTRFRPLQSQVINCFLARRDSFVLLPTGGGKSLCYQLPALLLEGVSVIISPLVSLMHDQVEQLKAMGIHAAMLSASSSKQVCLSALPHTHTTAVRIRSDAERFLFKAGCGAPARRACR
jgi:ATP-dependent DNA helicase RecQ